MKKWYKRNWESYDAVKDNEASAQTLRTALEDAVKRQLMSDVPYGVLLSGGLDSSIISAIAKNMQLEELKQTASKMPGGLSFIHSLSA